MQLFFLDFSPVQMEAICHASHREHVQSATHPHISGKNESMKTQPTCDKNLYKLFHVLKVYLYAEDASRGGLEKKKKR